ncbi:MAG: YidC/Oxa1 family membrane protein insertase, partial [Acidimicrobiia bacterium]
GYLQFKQTQSRQTSQANPQMAMMGKIFPVMFAFISFTLPSGVVLYFLVSNAWQIGQQALIYGHLMPDDAGPAGGNGAVEKKAPPPPKARDPKPDARSDGADGKADRSGKAPGKDAASGGTAQGPESFGRAQPSGSRPRPKRRRR